MAGGQGQRLWPLSRAAMPKQFLQLGQADSLLASALRRARLLPHCAPAIVLTGERERFLAAERLRESGQAGDGAVIVLEPEGRNTAATAAVAALHAHAQCPDALLLLLPADHRIEDENAFAQQVSAGVGAADAGRIVVFGVPPHRAETGYGYIRHGEPLPGGGHTVHHFAEKPNAQQARQFLDSGDYSWNSGMFLLRADVAVAEFERWAPDLLGHCRESLRLAESDLGFLRLNAESFRRCERISLDYAVMERTDKGAVFPLSCGWSDIGSWTSLRDIAERDARGNANIGDVLTVDSDDCYLHSESRLVAAFGLRDISVVETEDAVLVADIRKSQQIKTLIAEIQRKDRPELVEHRRVHRPWGFYHSLLNCDGYQVKLIHVLAGAKLSLQRHRHRSEHWVAVHGVATVTNGDRTFPLRPPEATYIPVGTAHRLVNDTDTELEIIETQLGSYLGEDDIERLEDHYGRDRPSGAEPGARDGAASDPACPKP